MVKHNSTKESENTRKLKSTMLTTGEVARIFGVHPATIRQWCSQGKIKYQRTGAGGQWRFKREDIAIAYLDRSIRKYLNALSDRP